MRVLSSTVLALALTMAGLPAWAQMQMPSPPQPQARTPDIPPPAVPGVGAGAPLATGPKMQPASSGDPTAALFAAVAKGDYNAAQDALSRGADLNAKNQFGETPLDLSIALNRATITFLILQTRNELGDNAAPVGQSWALSGAAPAVPAAKPRKPAPMPVAVPKPVAPRKPPASNDTGTPNPQAGFLGFGPLK
jgi:hypothetical protein